MRRLRSPRFWAGCLAGWALLTLVEATALHFDALRAGRASQLATSVLDRAASDLVWLGVAAAVFVAMERVMATGAGARAIAVRFAALGAVLAPLYVPWGSAARTVVHGGDLAYFTAGLRALAGTTLIWDAFLYAMLVLTACMILVSQRSRRHERDGALLKARLAQAELELLRAQLEPHLCADPRNGGAWTAAFEIVALGGAAAILAVPSRPALGRLCFGLALPVFGLLHFVYRDYVASVIPGWIPAHMFWAYATGVAHIAAGAGIVLDVMGRGARLAAILVGAMFGTWVVILHAPRALAALDHRPEWTSLFVALAMCGGAWLLAGRARSPC